MKFSFEPLLESTLAKVCLLAAEQGKLTGFCIGNTRKINAQGLYFSPIRMTSRMIAGSVIVYDVNQAKEIAKQIDGKVDYIFVDAEKKVAPAGHPDSGIGNAEREVRETIKLSRILTFKGNDLTVDSIENLIVQMVSVHPRGLGGVKGSIIGAGNIGSKLALKLVERGMDVTLSRRDQGKLKTIVDALNVIKPAETVAKVWAAASNQDAALNAHVLIGLTQGIAAITADMVRAVHPEAFLLDAGKGCFTSEAVHVAKSRKLQIYRADIRPGFEGHSAMALATEHILKHDIGRATIDMQPVVSGGLLGFENEIVVDSVFEPRVVFGIANGTGDFVRTPNEMQAQALLRVQNFIDQNHRT